MYKSPLIMSTDCVAHMTDIRIDSLRIARAAANVIEESEATAGSGLQLNRDMYFVRTR